MIFQLKSSNKKKFSRVEFMAAMVGLFRDWHVEPVPEEVETTQQARDRAMGMMENEVGQVLLLQLLHPERLALRWKKV